MKKVNINCVVNLMYLEGFLKDTITNITQKRKKRRKTVGIGDRRPTK